MDNILSSDFSFGNILEEEDSERALHFEGRMEYENQKLTTLLSIAKRYVEHGVESLGCDELVFLVDLSTVVLQRVKSSYIQKSILLRVVETFLDVYTPYSAKVTNEMMNYFRDNFDFREDDLSICIEKLLNDIDKKAFVSSEYALRSLDNLSEMINLITNQGGVDTIVLNEPTFHALMPIAIKSLEVGDYAVYMREMEGDFYIQRKLENLKFNNNFKYATFNFKSYLAFVDDESGSLVKFFSFLNIQNETIDVLLLLNTYPTFVDFCETLLLYDNRRNVYDCNNDELLNSAIVQKEEFILRDLTGIESNKYVQLEKEDTNIKINLERSVYEGLLESIILMKNEEEFLEVEKILNIIYGKI